MNLSSSEPELTECPGLWQTPEWFPINLLPRKNKLLLVPVSELLYREVNFLDDREIPLDGLIELPLDRVIRMSKAIRAPRNPVHCIYHIAFCGSTLIARCLDQLPGTLVLKEPLPFHEMACEKRLAASSGQDCAVWRRSFDLLMTLLGRTFHHGQAVIVKPTDASTNLIGDVLARNEQSRAIFLHVGLEEFLIAMLPDETRMGFVRDRLAELGAYFPDKPLFRKQGWRKLAAPEQAACLWFLHMSLYSGYVAMNPEAECRALDLNRFLQAPEHTLNSLARYFGIHVTLQQVRYAITASLGVHSKDQKLAYTARQRASRQREIACSYRSEIRLGQCWAARQLEQEGLPENPPLPLEAI